MENTSLAMDLPTPNLSNYDTGPSWQNVREYSFPLAVFGAVLTSILPFLSIGGSVLLLVVIVKFPQLRHVPSNLLLASLAVSDLLIGLLVQPLHAAGCLCALTKSHCWIFPSSFLFYVGSLLAYSSCLHVAMITIDRYICIVESLRYLTIVTETRAIRAILISWLISAVLPVMRLIPFFPMTVFRVFQIVMLSSVLSVIFFCYGKIFCISQRHKRQIISQLQAVTQGPIEQEFQSAKTVLLVAGAVFLSYAPLIAVQLSLNANLIKDHVKIVHPFAVTLFLLNSSVNPLIIFFRSRKLRRFLKKLFKRDA
ncbi:cannabinoid receptor 2-like [Oculina patagonica]